MISIYHFNVLFSKHKIWTFTNTRTNLRKYAQHRLLEDQKGNKLIKIDMETLRGIAYKSKVLFYEVCSTMQTSPQKLCSYVA